jgi:predicted PurR-regulated permease PerM
VILSVIALLWVASQVVGRIIHIVVVLLLAMVLAYALEPPLAWAERALPRALAAVLIYVIALSVLTVGVLLLSPPLSSRPRRSRKGCPATSTSSTVTRPYWDLTSQAPFVARSSPSR